MLTCAETTGGQPSSGGGVRMRSAVYLPLPAVYLPLEPAAADERARAYPSAVYLPREYALQPQGGRVAGGVHLAREPVAPRLSRAHALVLGRVRGQN